MKKLLSVLILLLVFAAAQGQQKKQYDFNNALHPLVMEQHIHLDPADTAFYNAIAPYHYQWLMYYPRECVYTQAETDSVIALIQYLQGFEKRLIAAHDSILKLNTMRTNNKKQ